MKTSIFRFLVLGYLLILNQNCKRIEPIQSLDKYVETIFTSLRNNKFDELKPLLLVLKDSSSYNDSIYMKGVFVRDDITAFMKDKEANKKYRTTIESRFDSLYQEFVKRNINLDSITFETKRLRWTFHTDEGNFRSTCDIVFKSRGIKYILVLSDILYADKCFKNFNFQLLETYEAEFKRRHKNLMDIVPFTGISVEEWNVSASSKDYSSPVRLHDFVLIINNPTHWDLEGFTIKITLLDKRTENEDQIYSILISRQKKLNHGERIQVKVPEFDDFIISKSVALAKAIDAKFEIVDLEWKDEFDLGN